MKKQTISIMSLSGIDVLHSSNDQRIVYITILHGFICGIIGSYMLMTIV